MLISQLEVALISSYWGFFESLPGLVCAKLTIGLLSLSPVGLMPILHDASGGTGAAHVLAFLGTYELYF